MPALKNATHEKFAHLIAESGDTATAAYAKINPKAKNPDGYASTLARRADINARIAEIREEVLTRSVLALTRKRELLRQMGEGIVPTKVINRANGVEEVYDKLAAIALDAKLAGEMDDRLKISQDNNLSLTFTVRDRESRTIDGEGVMDAVVIPDAEEGVLSLNDKVDIPHEPDPDSPGP
jgi:hypothetical protein